MDQKWCKLAFLCDTFRLKVFFFKKCLNWNEAIYLLTSIYFLKFLCARCLATWHTNVCPVSSANICVATYFCCFFGLFLSIWDKWCFGSRLLYFERNVSKARIKHPFRENLNQLQIFFFSFLPTWTKGIVISREKNFTLTHCFSFFSHQPKLEKVLMITSAFNDCSSAFYPLHCWMSHTGGMWSLTGR